jgi:hypothetical protein
VFNLDDKVTIADAPSPLGHCRRLLSPIIVVDGQIQWISPIGDSHLIVNKLWLPSSIKTISCESFSENQSLKSVVIENECKLEGIESETFQKTSLKFVTIPNSIGVLGEKCFSECGSLGSITFESGSGLSRIGNGAFQVTVLIEIILPSSVEVLSECCFSLCRSLSSVAFESGSRLSRIKRLAFFRTGLIEIVFLHLLKCSAKSAFLNAHHFPQFELSQGRDCHELKGGHSFTLF